MFLKLSFTSDIDKDLVNKKPTEVNLRNVTCRFCSGPHWSAQCPFKDKFSEDAEKKRLESVTLGAEPKATSGKYVPPAQRAREEAEARSAATGQAVQEQSNTIRIANISDNVTDQDIRQLCSCIGQVSRVYLAKDMDTGRSRGFAFVTFMSMADAERAVKKLHGHLYANMVLAANMAENRK